VEVISPERRYTNGWGGLYVLVKCLSCQTEKWTFLSNLKLGKSAGCHACSKPRQVPKWLERRFAAARQRCTNPNDIAYHRYGGRGIKFNFESVIAASLYMINEFGTPPRAMEIDRRDNNGHYEPGNVRWVAPIINKRNTRRCKHPVWNQAEWPYAKNVVFRYLAAGMTREEILAQARLAVFEKRKNWRGIQERLESLTS
jgi:hypothetical protein